MLNAAVARGALRGLEFGRQKVSLTHLLFADDSLVFLEAEPECCVELSAILDQYEKASGQKVNLSKSSLFFSKGASEVCREEITAILGMPQGDGKGKYLGLPFMTGRSKKEIFAFVRERVVKKLSGWKEKYLSPAGREVIIKSVIQAIPTYVMQCFLMPKSLINELEVQIRRFFWGGTEGAEKIHWKSWRTCCLSKKYGGLGFRDLESFNRALLAKQAWRLLKAPTSLPGTILKAKYYHNSDILNAPLSTRPSYMWRSILNGRDLLAQGVRWRVGDGSSTRIYLDQWLPLEPHLRPVYGLHSLAHDALVHELLVDNGGEWNMDLIEASFFSYEVEKILAIPLLHTQQPDKLIWHYHAKGVYTVRSGYHLAVAGSQESSIPAGPSSSEPHRTALWKLIWDNPIQPRIQHFLWKLLHDCLPLAANLCARGLGVSRCPLCDAPQEDVYHCFIACSIPSAVFGQSELMQRCLDRAPSSMLDLLWSAHHFEGESGLCVIANILWQIWKSRCSALFEGTAVFVSRLLNMAEKQADDHAHAVASFVQPPPKPPWPTTWRKPGHGFVKVNVDGAKSEDRCAVGLVIRDMLGNVLHAKSRIVAYMENVAALELTTLHVGLLVTFSNGYSHIELEGDSLIAFSKLNADEKDLSVLGPIVDSIKSLATCFPAVKYMFTKRAGNVPAHLLARLGLTLHVSTIWNLSIPHDVSLATLADLD